MIIMIDVTVYLISSAIELGVYMEMCQSRFQFMCSISYVLERPFE